MKCTNCGYCYDSEVFKRDVENEWAKLALSLKPVLDVIEEDDENRESPEGLIGEDDTVER